MSPQQPDPRITGPRDPVKPSFDTAHEEQELTNLLLEGGQSTSEAQRNARHAIRNHLGMAENNGEAIWIGLNGLQARGSPGRIQLAAQILARDRLASFGPDPMEVARKQLRARGWTDDEIASVAHNRLHRDEENGEITFGGRIAGEHGWSGDKLIALAVTQFHAELTRRRQLEPDPKVDAEHKKNAARRGLHYSA
jgi:hypothetical protein